MSLPKPYYDDGNGIVIYHGDCREILPHLPKVDACVTSPPYNLGGFHQMHGGNSAKWEYASCSDDMPENEYQESQRTLMDLLFDVVEGPLFYSHKNRIIDGRIVSPLLWMQQTRWVIHQQVIVNKGSGANVDKRRFFPVHEVVLVCLKDPRDRIENEECLTDVWQVQQTNRKDIGHPATMPKSVATRCIGATHAFTILDPFMGSGTTLRAAKDLGRKCIGIEIEEKYCEIAVKRLSQKVLSF